MSAVDGNSDFLGDLQRAGATVSVLCDNHTTLCLVSSLRLRGTLIHTIRPGPGGSANNF